MEEKDINKLVEQTAQEFMVQSAEGKMGYSDFELLKEKLKQMVYKVLESMPKEEYCQCFIPREIDVVDGKIICTICHKQMKFDQ